MMQKQMMRKKTAAGMEKQNLGKKQQRAVTNSHTQTGKMIRVKEKKKIAVAVVEEHNLGEGQQEASDSSAPKEKNSTEKKIAAAAVEEKPNFENSEQTNSSDHQNIRKDIVQVQETRSFVSYKKFTEDYVGTTPVFVYRPFNERMDRYANYLKNTVSCFKDSLQRNANQQGRGYGTQPHDGHS